MPLPARLVAVAVLFAPAAAAQERPPEAWQLALGLQQRGLHQEAAQRLEQFLQDQPRHALASEAWYRLGVSRQELKALDAAATAFARALRDPKLAFRPECLYRLGGIEREQGRLEPAAGRFAELVRGVAQDHYLRVPAQYAEGECRRDLKDDAAAAQAFEAAAAGATGPDHQAFRFAALYQAGFARQRQGEFAAAAQRFAAAAEAAADDAARAECHYLCGDAALRADDPRKARGEFETVLRLGGDFADDAALGLGFCALRLDEADAALAAFRAVVQHFQGARVVEARLELGRLLHARGEFAQAARELEPLRSASALTPAQRTQVEELLGLCALELGSSTDAIAALQKALADATPDSRPRLQVALGDALSAASRWQEALAAYEAVPADAAAELRGEARYGAAFCLHQLGRHDDSTARARQLLAEQPQHRLAVHAAFAVAENRFAQRRWAEAQAAYASVPGDHELAGRAAFKAAWCVYLQDQKGAAAVAFQRLAGDADNPFREEALSMAALALLEAGDEAQALTQADRYRAAFPQGAFLARTERVAARVLRQRGDYAGAAARLQKAAAAAGGDAGLGDRLEEAELHFQQGDFQRARQGYAALAERDDELGARALEGLAWCAFELGDDADCARALARGLGHGQVGARKAGLLELQAALKQRQQDWRGAADVARAFLQEFPRHARGPELRYALGLSLARAGDHGAARRELAALAKAGGCARMDRVHYELAWACRRAGDEPAALAAFAEVLRHGDDAELQGEARLHLGAAALAKNDLAAARQHLAVVQGSHRGRALYQLGFAELAASDGKPELLPQAEAAFAAVVALGPGEALHGEATFCLGECRLRRGAHQEAAEALLALLQREPQHERAQVARLKAGECLVALGRHGDAASVLESFVAGAVPEQADLARGHLLLGKARLGRGQHAAAEAAFQRVTALSDGPLAAEAQFRLGESRAARGDHAAAAEAFVALPILYAHEEWVARGLLQAGTCYQQLGQPDKASRFFEELIARFPQREEARAAQKQLR